MFKIHKRKNVYIKWEISSSIYVVVSDTHFENLVPEVLSDWLELSLLLLIFEVEGIEME